MIHWRFRTLANMFEPVFSSTRDTTDELPQQIRDHLVRIRESETPGDDQAQASIAVRSRTKLIAFRVNRVLTQEEVEHQRELKDLPATWTTVGSPRLSNLT